MNLLSKLFLTSVRPGRAVDSDTTPDQGTTRSAPALITIQSLATFPGAALAITIVWKFFDKALGIETRWVPILAAFAVGAILYWAAISSTMPRKDKVIGAGIAVINAMYLALSVLGIDIGLDDAGIADQSAPSEPE